MDKARALYVDLAQIIVAERKKEVPFLTKDLALDKNVREGGKSIEARASKPPEGTKGGTRHHANN